MGENRNIGQQQAVSVFGNPESSIKLIRNHGQLCKVKQALLCPCAAKNFGSPSIHCTVCNGDGYIYTYQRRFKVIDEDSQLCENVISPYYIPILDVSKVQNVTSEVQGGIRDIDVVSFDDNTITLAESLLQFEKRRVTYTFDGWTYVEEEELDVDAVNGIMYVNDVVFDAGYQSSNPLNAYADIAQIVKIWNSDTMAEIETYTFSGRAIFTDETIVAGKMKIEYYYADLTQVINTDLITRNENTDWTRELTSGETRLAFYPFMDIARGDIVVIAATVLYKNEAFTHLKDIDKLWEMEILELNNVIIDESGNKYFLNTDYILQGRHVKWISSNKPAVNAVCTVRYGYKPAFIVFEDNPQPNTLENKNYPKICLVKSWSKISKDDIAKLVM